MATIIQFQPRLHVVAQRQIGENSAVAGVRALIAACVPVFTSRCRALDPAGHAKTELTTHL
jgi:hypothetical protein